MPMKEGTRVTAWSHSTEETVFSYGSGIYMGNKIPPEGVEYLGTNVKSANPQINLDNGKTVWGCECWWGEEAAYAKAVCNRKVVLLDIDEERAKINKRERDKKEQKTAEKEQPKTKEKETVKV